MAYLIYKFTCPSICPTRHSLRGNWTRTGTATAVRSGNLQADANRRAEFPVPSLWAKLLEEIRLGHSSAERRPGIADVKNGVTGPVRRPGPARHPPRRATDRPGTLWGLGNFRIWFSGHGFQDLGSQLWGLDFQTRGFQDGNLKTFRT